MEPRLQSEKKEADITILESNKNKVAGEGDKIRARIRAAREARNARKVAEDTARAQSSG